MAQTKAAAVMASNVPTYATHQNIADFFSFCGKISHIYVKKDKQKKNQTATVCFESPDGINAALLLDKSCIKNQSISIVAVDLKTLQQQQQQQGITQVDPSMISFHKYELPADEMPSSSVIASWIAEAYVLSSDTLSRAKSIDDQFIGLTEIAKSGIQSLWHQVQNMDSKYHITEQAVSTQEQLVNKAKTYEEAYHIKEKVSEMAEAVKIKAEEFPPVKIGIDAMSTTANVLKDRVAPYKDIYKETQKAIEEKKKERAACTSPTKMEKEK